MWLVDSCRYHSQVNQGYSIYFEIISIGIVIKTCNGKTRERKLATKLMLTELESEENDYENGKNKEFSNGRKINITWIVIKMTKIQIETGQTMLVSLYWYSVWMKGS